MKRATGRDLALNGKIGLKPSLWPTIQAADVAFSNPPGFSRPQMATLQGMELQLALLPLLSSRIEIDRLVLIHPDILLETDAAGQPNWQMTPEVSPATPAGSQATGPGRRTSGTTTSRSASTRSASRTARSPTATTAPARSRRSGCRGWRRRRLPGRAAASSMPTPVYNGTAFNLVADTGSLTRLQDPAATIALAGEAGADRGGREAGRRRIADPAAAGQGLRPGRQRHGARRRRPGAAAARLRPAAAA